MKGSGPWHSAIAGRVVRAAAMLAGLSAFAPAGPEYAGPGDPWAIGYAVQIARSCPDWQVERQPVLAARGVLPRMDFGSPILAMDGPFSRELYRGQAEAEADHRRHPDLCLHLPRIAGPGWPRLARVMRPAAASRRRPAR